jgi:hypothetical protein
MGHSAGHTGPPQWQSAATIEKGDIPMVTQHTVRDERVVSSAARTARPDRSVRTGATRSGLCPHCQYNPASPRIFGYCSWDCHDADEEDEPCAA